MKKLLIALFLSAATLAQSGIAQVPMQEQLQTADNQLNQVYQQLRGTLNDTQKQQLKQAQRDWIKKRDAFVAANPGNPQGALYQATMQRVVQLRGIQVGNQWPIPQRAVVNNINLKNTQAEKVAHEEQSHVMSTQDGQSNQNQEAKNNTNEVVIALQKPHFFVSEEKAEALNVIFLKRNDLLVTYCQGRDLGTTELKIWERFTGKCLRTLDLNNDFKWIFPSPDEKTLTAIAAGSKIRCGERVSIDVNSGEDVTKYAPKKTYEHLADGSVRRNNLEIAPLNYYIGYRQGICGDAFWTIQTPYIQGKSRDKPKKDQEIEVCIYTPELNIKCNLPVKSILNSCGDNELSINEISTIYPLDASSFVLLIKNKAVGFFVGSQGSTRTMDKSSVEKIILKNKELLSSHYAINYELDKGSFLSSDTNTAVILKSDGGRLLASTTLDSKTSVLVGVTAPKTTKPIQVSVSSGAEKMLVSFKTIISGINLMTGNQDFIITSSESKIFNNPILSPAAENIFWTEIIDSDSDPLWFEKTGSREGPNGDVYSAVWSQSNKKTLILNQYNHQGYSPDLDRALFINLSNTIASISLDKNVLQTNRVDTQDIGSGHVGLSKDSTWIIQLGYNDTAKRGLYQLSNNDTHADLVTPYIIDEDSNIVNGTTEISDFAFSKEGSYLALVNSKYTGNLLLSTNVAVSPKLLPVDGITSARWLDNEKLYLTSQTGVVIVSSIGKILSSWNLPNSKAAEGNHKWAGPDSWAYDSMSRSFFFAAIDGAVHAIKLNKDDSLKETYQIFFSESGNPIFTTPENFYATHSPKASSIAFTQGVHSYPLEQFDLRLNRPDIVLERLGAPKEAIETAKSLREKRLKRMAVTEEMLKPDFHLPELQIVGEVPATTPKNQLDLQIKATDDKYPLDRLRVYVNNVPVNGRDGELLRDQKTQSLEKTLPIKLAAGRNKIQVSVLNSAGAESLYANAEVNCTAERPKPKLYAVAMGVSQYDRPEWCLKYAAKDATDLIGKLKEKASTSYSEVKPLLLTDKEVTKESATKIKEFLSGATIDDTVLIFMAGHGLLDDKYDYYFGTTDIDPAKPSERGMPYEAIDNILAEVPSLKKALLMDTCHAGELDDDEKKELATSDGKGTLPAAASTAADSAIKGTVAMRAIGTRGMSVKAIQGAKGKSDWYEKLQDMFVDLRRGSGSTVISSSQGAEYAFESSEQSNGLFTYSLMEALDGKATPNKDGQITINGVGDYVKKRVQDLTKGKQNPNLRGVNLEEDFALSSTK